MVGARGAFAAWLAAVVVLVASEGAIGLTLLVVGVVGAAAVLAGGYWFLAKRGHARGGSGWPSPSPPSSRWW